MPDTATRWIELEGAVNVRHLGFLPTRDGRITLPHRLIRSDNLQSLTATDVRWLVDTAQVRAVLDLRTEGEIEADGPGPLTREPGVVITHLSLMAVSTLPAAPPSGVVASSPLFPDQQAQAAQPARPRIAPEIYVGYLRDRPDSVLAGLRTIAYTEGSTVVHCAAGKDRTGILVAIALEEVGVQREAIIEDYALTGERIEQILARLVTKEMYAGHLDPTQVDRHKPLPETMERALAAIDDELGGVPAYLRSIGWTDTDAAALRARLLG